MKKVFLFLLSTIVATSTYETRAQGTMWGVTQSGGTFGGGTLFKANFDATNFQKVKDFAVDFPGRNSFTRLVAGPSPNLNGKLYGVMPNGGTYDFGHIFQYDPSNSGYTKVYDFTGLNGSNASGPMVLYNNKFYGVTYSGGIAGYGVFFSFDPVSGSFTKEADFDPSTTGSHPNGYITLFNNKFYGTTSAGGATNAGVLFEFDPAKAAGSNLVNKYDFNSSALPQGELVVAGSLIYGVTSTGGANNLGTIFEFDPAAPGNNYTKKVDFDAATGSTPTMGMTLVSSQLYGATSAGGANSSGTIFQYTPGATSVTVKTDVPSWPYPGISVTGTMLYTNGLLYGNNSYSMFSFDPNSLSYSELVRYDLTYSATGVDVHSGYTLGPDGNLYGITYYGGVAQGGAIIKYNPAQAPGSSNPVATLSFNTSSGTFQPSQLIYLNGKLYGHSYIGDENRGTIFEYTPADGTFIDTGFDNFSQGSFPSNPIPVNGKLYGTIGQTVYEYDPATHTITDKIVSGLGGVVGFTAATNGLLYGISTGGGANNTGFIVEYDPVGNSGTKKLDFESTYNATAISTFSLASNGLLYAVAPNGGVNSKGYLIEYTPGASIVSKKYEFNTGTSYYSSSELITCTANGKLYNVRTNGGTNGMGSIWEYTLPTSAAPNGVVKEVYSFPSSGTGLPWGVLVESGNGKLYGSTLQGGANGQGIFFEYDPIKNSYAEKTSYVPIDGFSQGGLLVIPDPQSITFNAPAPTPYASVLKPATASSSLPLKYTSSDTNVAISQGDSIIVVGIGTTTITASQPGNGGYLAATPVQQMLTTIKAAQTITFSSLGNKKMSDSPVTLSATTSSTLAVTYISSNPAVASISGNAVTILSRGATDIQASQAGNDNYNAATPVTRTLTIINSAPTVANTITEQETFQLSSFTFTFANNVFSDADGDALTYTATKYDGSNLAGWLTFNAGNRTFSGTPGLSDTTTTIRVTANDGFGGTVNTLFKISVKVITAIEPDANSLIKIYPNPVQHTLMIENESADTLPVVIRTSLGVAIYQNDQSRHEVNTQLWAAGLYFVEVRNGNTVTQTKVIKY